MQETQRRRTIALLFDNLSSEYAVHLRRAVERAASRRDVSVLSVAGQPLAAPEAVLATQNQIYDVVTRDRVDGVIVVSATIGHYVGQEGLIAFCKRYAPLPVCSLGVELPDIPSVVIDNQGGMFAGTSHLIERHGCRRIAFIAGPKASTESNLRLVGYRQAHAELGLPVDESLIFFGDFTLGTGTTCMRRLLASGVDFDAVVAANDDMALGAMDVLQAARIQVPRDVMVAGFDDINSAHFARPSLSTLRQPMWWLGERAVDIILKRLGGEDVPLLQTGQVDFIRRESCGCGYQVGVTLSPSKPLFPSLQAFTRARRPEIIQSMHDAVTLPKDALGDWPEVLLSALDSELGKDEGQLGSAFEEVLERAQQAGASLDEFQRVVSAMRAEFRQVNVEDSDDARHIERLWHNARVLVGAASIRFLGRQKLEQQQASAWLSWVGERLTTTLSLSLLKEQLYDALPRLEVRQGCIATYVAAGSRKLKVLAAVADGKPFADSGNAFGQTELAPTDILCTHTCRHFVVLPISFETEMLGVAVLENGCLPSVYEGLRQQIGSALKGAMMHNEIVAQVTLRERLESERMSEEARVAVEIQTSMAPSQLRVPGLELAGVLLPVAESGGDYYDVLPTEEGAWLAIGDVTGHGLGSGLVMLMLQSMISSLSRVRPPLSAGEVVSAVGDAIWDNVRQRLRRDDHATLTVLRYYTGGRFVFAGAHEDLIVWRAATRTCELVKTQGMWVGAMPSVRALTEESELLLNPGDLLVLYTDGIIEARNAHKEQFSVERMLQCIEEHATQPAHQIRDAVIEAAKAWTPSPDDDMTLLVLRYQGET